MAKRIKWISHKETPKGPIGITKAPTFTKTVSSKEGIQFESELQSVHDKEKAREFAEVFTPPHIVRGMVALIPQMSSKTRNLDLCAGHGQFTEGMLKALANREPSFNKRKYLKDNHFISELQVESCYKILKWLEGYDINLAIGDALQLGRLPVVWRGIWVWVDGIKSWVKATTFVRNLLRDTQDEKEFSGVLSFWISHHKRICKEYQMNIKHMIETKEGRTILSQLVRETAGTVEHNWQDVQTPDWVVQEMCRLVPDLKTQKKILVLFNIEFLECLIKDCGVHPSHIEFGSDSAIEEKVAQRVYNVTAFSIGKNMDEFKGALDSKAERYDVVFSNPPYQTMDEGYGASAKPLYHKIVEYAIDVLKPHYVCMITPSRWMAGGKGLDDYRARMLKDKHLKIIQDYPGTFDIFKTVGGISGGVSYFLWDRDYNGLCEFNGIARDIGEFDVLVRDNTAAQILRKVLAVHKGPFCNEKVLSRKPFGLATNFKGWVPEGTPGAVRCYCPLKDGFEKWVSSNDIQDTHGVLAKWKTFTPTAGWGGNAYKGGAQQVISQIFVGDKLSACLETYIVAGYFNSKKEAGNYAEYMKTKFYRFMLSLRVISQHINKEKFAWVPDFEDYTHGYTDEDLYKHFELTKKEVEHIESTIKSL